MHELVRGDVPPLDPLSPMSVLLVQSAQCLGINVSSALKIPYLIALKQVQMSMHIQNIWYEHYACHYSGESYLMLETTCQTKCHITSEQNHI